MRRKVMKSVRQLAEEAGGYKDTSKMTEEELGVERERVMNFWGNLTPEQLEEVTRDFERFLNERG